MLWLCSEEHIIDLQILRVDAFDFTDDSAFLSIRLAWRLMPWAKSGGMHSYRTGCGEGVA